MLSSYDYAILRVVPQVTREEFVNVGVILFCRELNFLDLRLQLDTQRLLSLAPAIDLPALRSQLAVFDRICAGGASSGPIGQLSKSERFHWLTSPRSTTLQLSSVHCGLCSDPDAELEDLFSRNVATETIAAAVTGTQSATPENLEDLID